MQPAAEKPCYKLFFNTFSFNFVAQRCSWTWTHTGENKVSRKTGEAGMNGGKNETGYRYEFIGERRRAARERESNQTEESESAGERNERKMRVFSA